GVSLILFLKSSREVFSAKDKMSLRCFSKSDSAIKGSSYLPLAINVSELCTFGFDPWPFLKFHYRKILFLPYVPNFSVFPCVLLSFLEAYFLLKQYAPYID